MKLLTSQRRDQRVYEMIQTQEGPGGHPGGEGFEETYREGEDSLL